MRGTGLGVLLAVCGAGAIAAPAAPETPAADPPAAHWAGVWQGRLVNWPDRPDAKPVSVTLEIGAYPTADNSCATWRTTYAQDGKTQAVKDYRLCRGAGPDDLAMDEGGGLKLAVRWIGPVMVTPFKYDNQLLVVTTRLRGEVLEEEIITADDTPAIKGVVSLRARHIQRLELSRRPTPPAR